MRHVQTAGASRHDVTVMLKLQPVRRNSALNKKMKENKQEFEEKHLNCFEI